jgi:hypothetical protein
MSRIQATVTATAKCLKMINKDGKVILSVQPREVISIGNSIGGYIVAPLGKPNAWGFWRLTGHQKCGILEGGVPLAEQIMLGKPAAVAISGRTYLFASSSGSARRGVLHTYRRSPDPIRRALVEVGCDLNTGVVDKMNFEAIKEVRQGRRSSTCWSEQYEIATDGRLEFKKTWTGCQGRIGAIFQPVVMEGGSYLIGLSEAWNGVSTRRRVEVYITATADRRQVAEALLAHVRDKARLGTDKWKEQLKPELLDR